MTAKGRLADEIELVIRKALELSENKTGCSCVQCEAVSMLALTLADREAAAEVRGEQRAREALPEVSTVLCELARAEVKHPTYPTDVIHAAAIVVEEAGELQQAALQATYEGGSLDSCRREAIQVGAMAIRFLLHFDMLDARQSERRARAEKGEGGR